MALGPLRVLTAFDGPPTPSRHRCRFCGVEREVRRGAPGAYKPFSLYCAACARGRRLETKRAWWRRNLSKAALAAKANVRETIAAAIGALAVLDELGRASSPKDLAARYRAESRGVWRADLLAGRPAAAAPPPPDRRHWLERWADDWIRGLRYAPTPAR